jgi:uncharacterized membrane protein (UPF0127 family)
MLGIIFVLLLLAGCGGEPVGSGATAQSSEPRARTAGETTGSGNAARTSELRTVTILTASGKEVRVRAEIADDTFERARGLMYRTALAENRGMLFVFPNRKRHSLYMKNTLIPLSVAFIDSEGRIVDIQDMKPLDDDLPHYVSAKPARYALEVNQGFFDERGIKVGDRAELPGQRIPQR